MKTYKKPTYRIKRTAYSHVMPHRRKPWASRCAGTTAGNVCTIPALGSSHPTGHQWPPRGCRDLRADSPPGAGGRRGNVHRSKKSTGPCKRLSEVLQWCHGTRWRQLERNTFRKQSACCCSFQRWHLPQIKPVGLDKKLRGGTRIAICETKLQHAKFYPGFQPLSICNCKEIKYPFDVSRLSRSVQRRSGYLCHGAMIFSGLIIITHAWISLATL